ncbi:probable serine/threonine-protein kinase DDB_G0267514 [Rhodamnia argentea]|uniref:Probable serine/threonine-protein kinase DDB_G0267514 n=1 Tax=Rhodamnia argentea TaxID=178133 RepID=A0ABM3HBS2_9MYRT|nr:probable serine/threonine-protein kinase DDB_G0267514 [Rhodamnia argentea]
MNGGGNHCRMSAELFASRPPCVQSSPLKRGSPAPRWRWGGLCCRFDDSMSMGSPVSTGHRKQQQTSVSRLVRQVEELEKEVQKERELRTVYKKRMERTQDYLRYCLQTAKDNGFLQLIVRQKRHDDDKQSSTNNNNNSSDDSNISNNNSNQGEEVLLSPQLYNGTGSPQFLTTTLVETRSDVSIVADQARINGWLIEPHEQNSDFILTRHFITSSQIELREKIGRGTTAEIYRATWRGVDVAVKCIFPDFFHANPSGTAFFAQELETLSRQRHRFVLQLMGACIDPPERAWIVTEFLGSTLKEWLHGPGSRRAGERARPLPPLAERLSLALEIAQAMQYLHEQKPRVIHRDLKPSNIFLDDAMHVRVADFGHARFLGDEELALTGETGTYVYMAPEVILCEPYDEKCDVYSFGVVLNELVTGEHPFIETDFGPAQVLRFMVQCSKKSSPVSNRSSYCLLWTF